MGALVPIARTPEILGPEANVRIIAALHPLKLSRVELHADAGLTVRELALAAKRERRTGLRTRLLAWIDGTAVPEDMWDRVRLKPGATLFLRAVAEGGDSSTLRTLLSVAVAAAAIALPVVIFPAGGIAAALLGAGITIGGQLLVNALFPVSQPKLADSTSSQTYSIAGPSNVADLYGVVPVILGKMRVYPKLGAVPYTEFVGVDQYVRMLFVFGYGPLDISDVRIGETPIGNYDDVDFELRQGYVGDAGITLYPSDVSQQDLSVDVTAAAGWQSRTSAAGIDEIAVDLVAAGGLVRVDSKGENKSYTVSIRVEISPAGAGVWSLLGVLDMKGRSTDAIRKTIRGPVAHGQYDVRVKKTSTDYAGSDHVSESVVWTALRGFTNTAPIAFPKPLALLAVRIRATSQLNGAISDINAICQSRVTSWSEAANAWLPDTVSNNPADLFRWVLQSSANARAVADARIDLDSLVLWSEYCRDNGFTFNMVRDFSASVWDTLGDVCAAGRASRLHRDGKWSVVWDDPNAPIAQHFTARNVMSLSGQRTYAQFPHAFRVRFVNEDAGYKQDERVVYDDGYNVDGSGGNTRATLFEQIEFPGVTSSGLNWRHGRFHIAQARLRPEIIEIETDIEHLAVTRGDRVRVAHDAVQWGLAVGRVKSIVGRVVTLDEPVTMEAGKTYAIRFRLADGSSIVTTVVTDDGENAAITIGPSVDDPEPGDLFMFGEVNRETVVMRVRSIAAAADRGAKLTLVDDAPAISTADAGAIPPFASNITLPVDPAVAVPVNLVVRETLEGIEGDHTSGVAFSWETLAGSTAASFETRYRDLEAGSDWKVGPPTTAPVKAVQITNLSAGNWRFEVRAIFANGTSSDWAGIEAALTGLAGIAVSDVMSLRATYIDKVSALTWDDAPSPTSVWPERFEVRQGLSWETGLFVGDVAHPPWVTLGDGTYWVARYVQPAAGVKKYSSASSLAIAGSVLVENVVATYDEAATGWGGTIAGPGAIAGGNFVTTSDNVVAYYEVPTGHNFDVGYARATRLYVSWTAAGVPIADDVLSNPDFLGTEDLLSSEATQYIDSWVEYAVAQSGSTDAFTFPDAFAPSDIFAGSTGFSPWMKFAPGVVVGQIFKFRVALMTRNPDVRGQIIAFSVSADVPDRVDHVTNFALPAGGQTFSFTPDGSATPTPFKGGPSTATVPAVQVTWNEQAGDQLVISGLTLANVTLQILNAGVGVARTITAFFQGW